jgi:hypothetical protein
MDYLDESELIERVPDITNPYELEKYIYKINRMANISEAFKAIMNCDIIPQHKIECIRWYNSFSNPQFHHNPGWSIPNERFRHPGMIVDADVEAKRKAEEKEKLDYHIWAHNDFFNVGVETPENIRLARIKREKEQRRNIPKQTWTEWRKEKMGFGGKTRKSRNKH